MREIGTFTLQIQPATTVSPVRVSIVVAGTPPDALGAMHLSPECVTLDELDGRSTAFRTSWTPYALRPGELSPGQLATHELSKRLASSSSRRTAKGRG